MGTDSSGRHVRARSLRPMKAQPAPLRLILSVSVVPLLTAAFATHYDISPCKGHGYYGKTHHFASSALHGVLDEFGSDQPNADDELPLDFPRRHDVLVALSAVRKACRVTRALQPDFEASCTKTSLIGTIQKRDLSPVTVADYAVQAVVLNHLQQVAVANGDNVGYIAEEDSSSLQNDEILCQQVMQESGMLDRQDLWNTIDLGKSYTKWRDCDDNVAVTDASRQANQSLPMLLRRPRRIWCLDPIDGTKGFLRGKKTGGQYCIALALLEDGVPTIGILGCPNLPTRVDDETYSWSDKENETNNQAHTRGCIFVASRDGGCFQLPLACNGVRGIRLQATASENGAQRLLSDGRFCIGVEKFSDASGQCAGMAQYIHGADALDQDGEIINARRMDSQAKHGVIARGGAEFYVRLPRPGYVEWIWDHAAGNVVIEEAGGQMTDTNGQPIDFSLGAKLSEKVSGVLMSCGGEFHQALVDAFAYQETRNQIDHDTFMSTTTPYSISFDRERHVRYFSSCLSSLAEGYSRLDTNRLTLVHFSVQALDLLGVWDNENDETMLTDMGISKQKIIDWIYSLQVPTWKGNEQFTGFLGGSFLGEFACSTSASKQEKNERQSQQIICQGHISMTYTALATLHTLGDDFSRVNRHGILQSLRALQLENGSFKCTINDAEHDMRFLYCACCISHMLHDWSGVNINAAVDYIRKCRSFDGAIALLPGQEGHGGSTFCAIASLALMQRLDDVVNEGNWRHELIHWCVNRQVSGMQGRPNKNPDTCYSYWIGGTMRLLGRDELLDHTQLRTFVMQCQTDMGGFSKTINDYPDVLHSFYSMAYISMSQTWLQDDSFRLKELNCTLGIGRERAALFHPLLP
ncbi:hypothetical protein MPSEU_000878700 [Mayamaea pseudoterrestris]|nr:hypothetical protein MPSEU_000878700 [Mayamaea pseudoterrestris]